MIPVIRIALASPDAAHDVVDEVPKHRVLNQSAATFAQGQSSRRIRAIHVKVKRNHVPLIAHARPSHDHGIVHDAPTDRAADAGEVLDGFDWDVVEERGHGSLVRKDWSWVLIENNLPLQEFCDRMFFLKNKN